MSVAGVVLVWSALRAFSKSQTEFPVDEPRILVTKRELPAGLAIDLMDLGFIPKSQLSEVPGDALTDQDLPLLKSARLKRGLSEKAVLTLDNLGKGVRQPTVPRGHRGYWITTRHALPLRKGDQVDVLSSSDDGATVVVEGLSVLGVSSKGKALLLAAKPREIELMEKAGQRGKLDVTLRNPFDAPREASLSKRERPRANGVEIITEGE